jgi:predicted lipoprotein with Yx(FWY)xxD motif
MRARRGAAFPAGVVAAWLVLAACTGQPSSNGPSSQAPIGSTGSMSTASSSRAPLAGSAPAASSSTLAPSSGHGAVFVIEVTHDPTYGRILVDRAAHPLYANHEAPAGAWPKCDAECTALWVPVVVPAGEQVSGGSGVGRLATVDRPDGTRQVSYQGFPLYRYARDPASGAVTGNRVMSGWQVAVV